LVSAVKLSLRSFDDGVRRAYARLFAGDPDKSREMLHWRFQGNPHGEAKFAVALDDDEVVGMIGLVPTRLRSDGGEIMAYQAIDTMVDPAHRGQGLFVKLGALAQDAQRLDASILWGFPYNAPFQAGQPVTVTSTCNATSTWLAQSTNAPANPPSQRGERGR
jgi:GNAT superfamily N-acetyltransferase